MYALVNTSRNADTNLLGPHIDALKSIRFVNKVDNVVVDPFVEHTKVFEGLHGHFAW